MIINVSEKPVISIDTGKVLGTLKGFTYNNNKVTSLYCKLSDKYVDIPMKDATIGSDAIMIRDTYDVNVLYSFETKVYTTKGEKIGTVASIEMNDSFDMSGITVNNQFIEIDNILHMEDIIVVETEKTNSDRAIPELKNAHIPNEVNKGLHNEKEEESNLNSNELNIKTNPTPEQQLRKQAEKDEVVSSENNIIEKDSKLVQEKKEEEPTVEIDPRYNYLLGKKLLEDITIVKETYKKGTPINASLIKYAIDNNAILKVIMNTED